MIFITLTVLRLKDPRISWPPYPPEDFDEKEIDFSASHMLSYTAAPAMEGDFVKSHITMPVGEMMVRETVAEIRTKIMAAIRREGLVARDIVIAEGVV